MTTYSYRARDINGLLVIGEMEGDEPDLISEHLAENGLIPLSVSKGSKAFARANLSMELFRRVNNEEIMLFTRQFHTLFKAGMDIETLLTTLANQTKNKYFSEAITRIKTDVAAGSSLSRAFSQHPRIFNELYTSMLATGEEAGILDQALTQITIVMEKEISLKASVKSAMLYPKIVFFVLIAAAATMMTVVIPKFASFYANFKAELPLPTRIMIGVSNFVHDYWYLCFGAVLVLIVVFKKWTSTTRGKLMWDRFKTRIPIFGQLGLKVANARYANLVASLYKAGLAITHALAITAKTIDNAAFAREVLTVKTEVEKGRGIAEAMRTCQFFSPLLVEATAIGEKSGALDDMYLSIGSHYDTEVQHTLKNLTTLIEPLLLFAVFGMVTLFALAVFLPMWGMSGAVSHH